jgi:hypothetical protein
MAYSLEELKEKLLGHHSDIAKHGVTLNVSFDRDRVGYVVELAKGGRKAETFISKKDADECMQGIECYHLGIEVYNFIQQFKEKT